MRSLYPITFLLIAGAGLAAYAALAGEPREQAGRVSWDEARSLLGEEEGEAGRDKPESAEPQDDAAAPPADDPAATPGDGDGEDDEDDQGGDV